MCPTICFSFCVFLLVDRSCGDIPKSDYNRQQLAGCWAAAWSHEPLLWSSTTYYVALGGSWSHRANCTIDTLHERLREVVNPGSSLVAGEVGEGRQIKLGLDEWVYLLGIYKVCVFASEIGCTLFVSPLENSSDKIKEYKAFDNTVARAGNLKIIGEQN